MKVSFVLWGGGGGERTTRYISVRTVDVLFLKQTEKQTSTSCLTVVVLCDF